LLQRRYTRSVRELPKYIDGIDLSSVDMVSELLTYLSEVHPNYLPPVELVETFDRSFSQSISDKMKAIEQETNIERALFQYASDASTKSNLPEKTSTSVSSKPTTQANSTILSTNAFRTCRLFLSHLGFLTSEGLKRLYLLEENPRLIKSLKDLDQLQSREVHKIGLIFVKQGQEDQNSILRNDESSVSDLFSEFMKGIGWMIDLKTHQGFLGGLDRTSPSSGKVAPYFADANLEVIFHAPTLMPSKESDPQQIEKKKHVGNDFVNIVWSEHIRDYKPTTISSQFNDAHVVIYPLPNGLFRIQIHRKEKISFFGPLVDGMVVSKRILCPLIRQTAINASKRARSLSKFYQKPFPTRNAFIKDNILRHKANKTFDNVMIKLFPSADSALNKEPSVDVRSTDLKPNDTKTAGPKSDDPTTSPSGDPKKVHTWVIGK